MHFSEHGNWFEVGDVILKNADIRTFQVLNESYAKDKNNAYYASSAITGADLATFTALSEVYAKDANKVYCLNKIIEDADLATFRPIGYYSAQDKDGTYDLCQRKSVLSGRK